jgi:hypothetical protein
MHYWIIVIGLAALAVALAMRDRPAAAPAPFARPSAPPKMAPKLRQRAAAQRNSEGGNLHTNAAPHPGEKQED